MIIFSIYDIKAQVYSLPVFEVNRATFMRSFGVACNEPGSPFNSYPDDYQVFEIGEWDSDTGSILPRSKFDFVGVARDFLVRAPSGAGAQRLIAAVPVEAPVEDPFMGNV